MISLRLNKINMLVKQPQIIPAFLTDSIEVLVDQVERVSPFVDKIHIDVLDGYFAPYITCCPAPQIAAVDFLVDYEVHLMVEDPKEQLMSWKKAGATRVIAHVEVLEDQESFVEMASSLGLEVGLALKVETDLDELSDSVASNLDSILLMAHEVGVQGAPFNDEVLLRIVDLRSRYEHVIIQVDGGLNEETLHMSFDAGANLFAVGSTIVESPKPEEVIASLRKIIA